jgi:hypothetical protein
MHEDMKRTPRLRAFFDFMIEELPRLRPLLSGNFQAPLRHVRWEFADRVRLDDSTTIPI